MPLPNNDDLLQESATISAYGSPPASLDQEKGSDMSMSKTIWIPRRFWAHYVSLDAPLATRRDHLSNEQTFLAWLSVADGMSLLGIVIAQISKIQQFLEPEGTYTTHHHALGKTQACICHLAAILILFVGAWRFFRHQREVTTGLAKLRLWGIYLVGTVVLLVGLQEDVLSCWLTAMS
ncbi:hypothetical protein PV05_04830 [Exophiala xenobiotica]|uniref:DUF202 domain-containing protein n=1 Tax=Exophiala xenobiotica TaxID=348802 RepID=A0A0D2EL33_9EURO|nr:uncharacterized protein PV05_04830 [Exophiala xenobiotica]KIW56148.1 hypothetical protein PV05_04830 [Exophiala xenobiotica]